MVHKADQIVDRLKVVKDVGPNKKGLWNSDQVTQLRVQLRTKALDDLPRQHHTGRLAADLATANPSLPDGLEVADGQELACQAHIVQLIAEHALGEDNNHFLEVVLDFGLFFGRIAFVFITEGKEHRPGRQLWVKAQQDVLIGRSRIDHLVNDLLDQIWRTVVGKVEIGQVVADDFQPLLPGIGSFFYQWIVHSLADL